MKFGNMHLICGVGSLQCFNDGFFTWEIFELGNSHVIIKLRALFLILLSKIIYIRPQMRLDQSPNLLRKNYIQNAQKSV